MKRLLRNNTLAALSVVFLSAALMPPPEAPVADAAERGDVEAVRALLREGADVNAAQGDGMTALHWASLENRAELVQLLLYAGAQVEPTTRLGGYTPLHLAAQKGFVDVVSTLLAGGADPNALTATGVAPLHFAAESGDVSTVQALVQRGADVNIVDAHQARTPLMFAAAYGRGAAMRTLLDAGADVKAVTTVVDYREVAKKDQEDRRRRQRMVAAARGEPEQRGQGGQGGQNAQGGQGGQNAQAGQGGQGGQSAGAPAQPDPDDRPEPGARPDSVPSQLFVSPLSYTDLVGAQGGFTALHYAARDGHMDEARMLLDAGADVNAVTGGDQSSALLVATINGNYDLARMLLERGADPNLVSEDGVGPLFAVVNGRWALRTWYPQPTAWQQQETDYLDMMRALLDAGADVNQRVNTHIWYTAYNAGRMGVDFGGATTFWRAAYSLDVAAMRLLHEYGADPDIATTKPAERRFPGRDDDEEEKEDPSGLPPVEVGGPAVHPLHAATGVGYGTSRVGQQHQHVPEGWLPAAKYLIDELGVDVNVRDHEGYSALHNAAARGDDELIKYLVSKGADPLVVSRRGQTTVDMANGPQQRVQPFPSTIELLEGLGAKNNHNCQSC